MKVAIEQIFDGSIQQIAIGEAYDAAKINRGKQTGQFDLGPGQVDKFIGPAPVGIANIGESPLATVTPFIKAVKINNDLFWIFGSTTAAAAATRLIQLWTFVPSTNTYSFVGFITLTFPSANAHVMRGLQPIIENYTTGTVSAGGLSVTGAGTAWNTDRLSVGSRIGFGSTDASQITDWYQISSIGSDTSITLSTAGPLLSAGTPYVIQDFMIVAATTNSTATSGGLFVAKGLRYEDFTPNGTTIPSAGTVDRIKAVYWLKDAATITNDTIGGCEPDNMDSWTQQYVYCTEGSATSLTIYRYNIRATLTLSGGAAILTGSDILITGSQTVTGNVSTSNNCRIATLDHGPGKGIPSLYILTTTRIYRAALASITANSNRFLSDLMFELPPGSSSTNVAMGGSQPFFQFDICRSSDKIIICSSFVNPVGTIFYVTDYSSSGRQMDRRAGCLSSQTVSTTRNAESPIFIHGIAGSIPSTGMVASCVDGWLFALYSAVSSAPTLNAVSAYPLAADWDFQSKTPNRIICPKITLGESPRSLYRVFVNDMENLGSERFGIAPEAYKVQVRISGIDDNTGSWIDVPQNGDLSGLNATTQIQFGFMFRTIGTILLPARILSLALVYESQEDIPQQYRWNFADFNLSNGTFAWVQASLFAAALTTHTIEVYRADTNALVLTQASTGTTNGTFEYWNGSAWVAGLGTDTVNTRRRFVPSGALPSGVDLYAKILVS